MRRILILALCAATAFARADGPALPSLEPFRDGDRWAAIGDSITHHGFYYSWVYLYYATRFPDRALEVANLGISGDTATGAVRRYEWDIQPAHATVATVMLGMNDVGRSLYGAAPATPEVTARRTEALDAYRKSMTELVRRLQAGGVRVVLITPTPFDEDAAGQAPPLTGVDGALEACAAFDKELAATNQLPLVDFHGPMKALSRQLRAANPTFSFNRSDRVHPGEPGHLVMTYLLLKAQGAPAEVSSVSIDASAQSAEVRNAQVDNLKATVRGVAFDCREKALPFPVPPEAKPALGYIPFLDELDREPLQVKGLEPGGYRLTIDGIEIGRLTADELRAGVNLAGRSETPQYRQAAAAMDVVERWRALVAEQKRMMALVEHTVLKDLPHPVDLAAAQAVLDKQVDALKDDKTTRADHLRQNYLAYPEERKNDAGTDVQLAACAAQIRSLVQPKSHHYEIVPAGP